MYFCCMQRGNVQCNKSAIYNVLSKNIRISVVFFEFEYFNLSTAGVTVKLCKNSISYWTIFGLNANVKYLFALLFYISLNGIS